METVHSTSFASDGDETSPGYGYEAYALERIDSPLDTSLAQALGLSSDDIATEIDLGDNSFTFYGQNYGSLWASSNGKITLNSYDESYSNGQLTTTDAPSIYVFWDDLYPTSGNIGYYQVKENELFVDWQNIPHIGNSGGSTATFQAILQLNTGTSDGYIILNYYDVIFDDANYNLGQSATIGIAGSNDYLQLSHNDTFLLDTYDSILLSTNGSSGERPGVGNEQEENVAPDTEDLQVRLNEDSVYTFASTDFAFTDTNDSLKSILISSAPTNGKLLFDGEEFDVPETGFEVAISAINKLAFVPDQDENGENYSSFNFKVVDQSDAKSEAATITINVDPVNDAPQINPPSELVQTSVGNSAYSNGWTDTAAGNAYIQETPSGSTGTVTQWKFYKPHANDGLWVTPVIYEKTESNTFIVRGIGRSRSASGPAGVYTFDFDLVEGSAVFANGNYTYGHIDKYLSGSGDTGTSTTGSVATVGSGTWGFINTQNPVTTIGGEQSLGYRMERNYASELILSSGGSRITGNVIEAGNEIDGTIITGIVSDTSTLTASDPDSFVLRWSIQGPSSTSYGSIAIDAETGVWTYTLDNDTTATQALAKGESVTETFTARVSDEDGAYDDQIISITIYGTNDKPLILTNPGSSALSDFSSTTAGWSNGSLVNSSAWGSFLGTFGSGQSTSKTFSESSSIKAISFDWLRLDSWDGEHFIIKANGVEIFSRSFSLSTNVTTTSSGATAGYGWTLTPHEYGNYWGNTGWNDQRFTIQIMPPEGIKELTLELFSTLDQGASDEAWGIDNVVVETQGSTTSGTVTEAGSADDGSTFEGTSSVSGSISASDPDSATLRWSITGSPSTRFGSITIDAETGVWTFTLDNDANATQALAEGESVTETFTAARVSDEEGAYDEHAISITIYGSNDRPVVTSSAAAHVGTVLEAGHLENGSVNAGTPSVSGTLTFSDVDDSVLITELAGLNNAVQLDGINDYVEIANSSALNFSGSDPFTLEAWVNLNGEGDSLQTILSKGPDENCSFRWGVYTGSDRTNRFFIWNGTSYVYQDNVMNSHWNSWTHLAASFDGSTLRMYANGLEVVNSTEWSTRSNTEPLTIGRDTLGRFTSGDIADVRIWNIARTASEIINNKDSLVAASSEGLIGNYIFANSDSAINRSTASNALASGTYINGASSINLASSVGADGFGTGATHSWSVVGSPSTTYGSIAIDAETGVWTYTLDNNSTATQGLTEGQSVTETYTTRVTDEFGAYSEQTIEITINGANDIVRQFADHVIAVSSEGQAGGGDRWSAVQALGAPDTNSYADLDTAWSPRERNGSGGSQADEYLELGFRRPVKATGLVIHETFGNGFVRRVDAIDTNGNIHLVWEGVDNSASEVSAFSISLDQSTDYLVQGLKIWVDIDHTPDWEQIDAVELIGWATQETYQPLAPTLDQVAGNDVVNAAEKAAGLVLNGTAEANSTIELSWGGILHTGLTGSDRRWSILVESLDIPEDSIESSITVIAIDTEGYQSKPAIRSIRISSAAAATPIIDTVANDNIINAYEKSVGVLLQGSAEGADFIELSWGDLFATIQVLTDGSWSTLIGGPNSQGVIPQDASRSLLTVVAIDADGNRSEEATRELVIDTRPPSSPSLNQVADDNIINAAEKAAGVTLTGITDLGTTVSVQWGMLFQTTNADSDGRWSIDVARIFIPDDADRSQIRLQATDVAGNQSSVTRERVKIDTQPPESPLIDQVGTDDILNLAESAQTVFLTGSAERGSLVEVDWNNRNFTTTATSLGRWSLPIGPENLPPNGSSTSITARATDAAGNRSAIATRSVMVDLLAPNVPVLNPVGQNGVVNALQKASGITLSGTGEAGTTISLRWARIEKQAQADTQGLWSVSISGSEIPRDGLSSIELTAMDPAGNRSETVSQPVVIDTKPPRAPRFIGKIANDGIVSAAERDSGILVQGTTDEGTSVSVSFAGLTKDATVTGNSWQAYFASSEIPLGLELKQLVTVIAADSALNSSTTATLKVVLNTQPPVAPTINVISGDDIVSRAEADSGLVLNGTSQAGNRIKIDIGTNSISTTANKDGLWKLGLHKRFLALGDGIHSVVVSAMNKSELSSPSVTRLFQLDQTLPSILASVFDGSTLILEGSEPMQPGQFNPTQFNLKDGRNFITIDNITVLGNDPGKLLIQLASPYQPSANLSLSYTPNRTENKIIDMNGNALLGFKNLSPTTLKTSADVNILAPSYINVDLSGIASASVFGNEKNNVINGNTGDNLISGGKGADILTGGGGRNVFRLNSLGDSLLGTESNPLYDHITDFAIGTDVIDAPVAVSRGQVSQRGSISSLNQANLTSILTPSQFQANSASIFSVTGGATERWFLALNDATAGFNASRDAIIEITGYTGSFTDLQII